jgi:hypothetical protein
MCCDQQQRAGDVEDQLDRSGESLATTGYEQDEHDSQADRNEQGPTAMEEITGKECDCAEQNDANRECAMKPDISGKIGDEIRSEADQKWCKQAVNEADSGGCHTSEIRMTAQVGLR